ncbi:CMRF35-like molecule 8 isoform X2 [Chanos chanos]|uniref:CMRF35-like molecule 8 isoform X2 n=1 Tax=Chanos chanos TaxID=29144 RepID=A0A6J2VDL9_CHACN|nr:CMRF35-like molecule 8 isoform X2 [Chanos chanos]
MASVFLYGLVLFFKLQGTLCIVSAVGELVVLEGQSVSIPCHYNSQYIHHVKYWCQGKLINFCTTLARTDDPNVISSGNGRVSIIDDPAQHVFTVTMRELKEADSGWYWCGVEVGNMWTADVTESLHIKVIHGMSVLHSRVSGEEGSSVDIQCLYSEKHRESPKKWCRNGDLSSCVVTDSSGTYISRSVIITDNKSGAFTVTMKGLERKDTGWYWCAAGQQQVSIHVSVTLRPTTAAPTQDIKLTTAHPPTAMESHSHHVWTSPLLFCGAALLVVTVILIAFKVWEKYRKRHKQRCTEEPNTSLMVYPVRDRGWKNTTSLVFLNSSNQQEQMS